jgi:hypothetical protein
VLLATQCFAWAVSQWAKQFTSPDGRLRFPDADARRALECRLYILAVLTHNHWALLNDGEKGAVELLFMLTLGPGMREVWVGLRNRGESNLLPAHFLSRYPKATEALQSALRVLSAEGLNGWIDAHADAQREIVEVLDGIAVVIDREHRKQSDPSTDLTPDEWCDKLLEALETVRPSAIRGVKTLQAGEKGRAIAHGTPAERARFRSAVLLRWAEIRAKNPKLPVTAIDALVGEHFSMKGKAHTISDRTVRTYRLSKK